MLSVACCQEDANRYLNLLGWRGDREGEMRGVGENRHERIAGYLMLPADQISFWPRRARSRRLLQNDYHGMTA